MAEKMMKSSMTMAEATDNPFERMAANRRRKKQILRSGGGKYAMPVRYGLRRAGKKIKGAIGDVIGDMKDMKGKKRQMEDASGPTSRNKSVGVCDAKGKCQ